MRTLSDKTKDIMKLIESGMPVRTIARALEVSRDRVRDVKGRMLNTHYYRRKKMRATLSARKRYLKKKLLENK